MLTVVCIPDLYPDPLLPILIAETIPVLPIIAVPPAATSDWYPNPSLDPQNIYRHHHQVPINLFYTYPCIF